MDIPKEANHIKQTETNMLPKFQCLHIFNKVEGNIFYKYHLVFLLEVSLNLFLYLSYILTLGVKLFSIVGFLRYTNLYLDYSRNTQSFWAQENRHT